MHAHPERKILVSSSFPIDPHCSYFLYTGARREQWTSCIQRLSRNFSESTYWCHNPWCPRRTLSSVIVLSGCAPVSKVSLENTNISPWGLHKQETPLMPTTAPKSVSKGQHASFTGTLSSSVLHLRTQAVPCAMACAPVPPSGTDQEGNF